MSIFVWRIWHLTSNEWLIGSYETLWIPGEVKQAKCGGIFMSELVKIFRQINNLHEVNDAPNVDCTCGIYGIRNNVNVTVHAKDMVIGIAEIWGKIIEAEFGYRAQYAKMRALIDTPTVPDELYGEPTLPSIDYVRPNLWGIAQNYQVPLLSSMEYARREFFA
jgi:hypothetical protein